MAAAATMALALPKTGLLTAAEVGELSVADISVPPWVYQRLGLTVTSPFSGATIVRVR